jgi:hypothetical protein
VHGSRHESDAYGQVATPGLTQSLGNHGLATLRIDIRGRAASREPRVFQDMAPAEREAVYLDVKAAVSHLAGLDGINRSRIGIVAEQDTAAAAILAGVGDRRVVAFALISGRVNKAATAKLRDAKSSVFCLVSKEDTRGFKDMLGLYLASKSRHSRIKVFEGLALGTTMFSTWRNEFPNEEPIEDMIAAWLAGRLNTHGSGRLERKGA